MVRSEGAAGVEGSKVGLRTVGSEVEEVCFRGEEDVGGPLVDLNPGFWEYLRAPGAGGLLCDSCRLLGGSEG